MGDLNLAGTVTARTASGKVSWTVIAGWLVVLVGAVDQMLAGSLIPAKYVGIVIAGLGLLKVLLRSKSKEPLDSRATAFARSTLNK